MSYGGPILRAGEKQCPQCRRIASLQQAQCEGCGRVFRTQFAAPTSDRTIAVLADFKPPTNGPVLEQCRRRYQSLVWWQIAGCAALLSLPVTLVFWLLTARVMGITTAFLFPLLCLVTLAFGISGLIHALVQKPGLRRQVAALGVDSQAWALPMDRVLWRATGAGTALCASLLFVGCLLITKHRVEKRELRQQALQRWRRMRQGERFRGVNLGNQLSGSSDGFTDTPDAPSASAPIVFPQ